MTFGQLMEVLDQANMTVRVMEFDGAFPSDWEGPLIYAENRKVAKIGLVGKELWVTVI